MNKRRNILIAILCVVIIGSVTAAFLLYYKRPNTWVTTGSKGIRYVDANREYVKDSWLLLDDKWYHFNNEGYADIGQNAIDGFKYHFDDNGSLDTGWVDIDGKKMYVFPDHTVAVGWNTIEEKKFYFDEQGFMLTGRTTVDGEEYILSDEGIQDIGWSEDESGNKCYVNSDGSIATGWQEIDGKTYCLNDEGIPETGWQTFLGDKYYFEETGEAATGPEKIDGSYYVFGETGKLITKDFLFDCIDEIEQPELSTDGKTKVQINDSKTVETFGGLELSQSDKTDLQNCVDEMRNCNTAGFVMINLYTGEGVGYNVDSTVYSASCIKGPYIASLVNYKPELLEKSAHTLETIVMYSDNKLYSSTRKTYGKEFFAEWCEESDIDPSNATYHYPQLSARSLAKLWVQNYYFFNTDDVGMQIKDWYISPNASAIYTALGTYNTDKAETGTTTSSNDKKSNSDTDKKSNSSTDKKDKGSDNQPKNDTETVVDAGLGYRTESKAGWICEGKYRATTDGGIIYPTNGDPYVIAIITDMPSDMNGLEPLCLKLNEIAEKSQK